MNLMNKDHPYVDEGAPASNDARIPRWLLWVYVSLPIWGIIWFCLFWNGSFGWFDRGAWSQLQQAANTTYPALDLTNPSLRER